MEGGSAEGAAEASTTDVHFCVYLTDEIDVPADEWRARDDHRNVNHRRIGKRTLTMGVTIGDQACSIASACVDSLRSQTSTQVTTVGVSTGTSREA